ncbi:MAG: ribbon-helix-helix domain-containing protein [Candidatus Nezhaarchaeales archaeon]|nr:MAG: transcriptional regulator [Candidatus Nezhaarchaeota archaeon WYZ-LMO7]TDA35213.1 MAG: transcriptional regulator [Candidatus Nezhaarchaeota archaeon WYZ-LMO8]
MRIITVKIPEAYLRELDDLVKAGIYPSRSEVIRTALRELLKKEVHRESIEDMNFHSLMRLRSRTSLRKRS